jgi:hypothetical protein
MLLNNAAKTLLVKGKLRSQGQHALAISGCIYSLFVGGKDVDDLWRSIPRWREERADTSNSGTFLLEG